MTLMNAPEYDSRRDKRNRNLLIAAGVLVVLTIVIGMGGFLLGHGWFFSNLPAEHKVNNFFSALEAKDYGKAFAIYTNDPDWEQHPEKHADYPLQAVYRGLDDGEPGGWPDCVASRRYLEDGWDGDVWKRDYCCGAGEWRPEALYVVRAQGWDADGAGSAYIAVRLGLTRVPADWRLSQLSGWPMEFAGD